MRKTFTVGISGGSGSGKTYFLNKMATHFDRLEICSISMDHYYKPREVQSIDENGVKNFDLPEAIDHKSFVTDIRRLKNGETLTKIEYTFNNPKSIPGSLTFRPAPLLLIEGLFVQYFEEVNSELDLRVFIESHNHLKLERRIRRDREERGYDLNDPEFTLFSNVNFPVLGSTATNIPCRYGVCVQSMESGGSFSASS